MGTACDEGEHVSHQHAAKAAPLRGGVNPERVQIPMRLGRVLARHLT